MVEITPITPITFNDAGTQAEQKAIADCPVYSEALGRAMGDPFHFKRLAATYGVCPKAKNCQVWVSWMPGKRTTISGKCLKVTR